MRRPPCRTRAADRRWRPRLRQRARGPGEVFSPPCDEPQPGASTSSAAATERCTRAPRTISPGASNAMRWGTVHATHVPVFPWTSCTRSAPKTRGRRCGARRRWSGSRGPRSWRWSPRSLRTRRLGPPVAGSSRPGTGALGSPSQVTPALDRLLEGAHVITFPKDAPSDLEELVSLR